MDVKLISYTKPVNLDMNLTDLVAYIARVSNPESQASNLNSRKLLKYLIDNKHWSPFEMVSICLEINTTRDIARQILRHRSFSFQEFSQRYTDPTKDLTFSTKDARLQDVKNRQSSIETNDSNLKDMWQTLQLEIIERAKQVYKVAIDHGIAKEQARAVLPEGLMGSRLYMHGTLRSWIHYVDLRSGNGTQKEHRDIAIECGKIIDKLLEGEL